MIMLESLKQNGPVRARFIAALSIIMFVTGSLTLFLLANKILEFSGYLKPSPGYILGFSIFIPSFIIAYIIRTRLIINIKSVASYFRDLGFNVYSTGKRVEAGKRKIQVSLYLESTFIGYDLTPDYVLSRKNRKVRVSKYHGLDPSYMYKEGVLRVVRRDSAVTVEQLRQSLKNKLKIQNNLMFKCIPEGAEVIVEKNVGAWMGKHLFKEIDDALSKASTEGSA